MEPIGGSAALSGMMMCVALGAWSLGRWQGLPGAADAEDGSPVPALPPTAGEPLPGRAAPPMARHTAQPQGAPATAAHDLTLDGVGPVRRLHEEVSAYRRTERVLAALDGASLALLNRRDPPNAAASEESGPTGRSIGVHGEPGCSACSCGACDAGPDRVPGPAPGRPASAVQDFARV